MNQEKEKQYREEFEKLDVLYTPHPMEGTRDYFAKNDDGEYRWSHIREDWQIYLAGRKKGDEELKAEHEDKVAIIKFQEKEISQLKVDLERSSRVFISKNKEADGLKEWNEELREELDHLKEQLKREAECVDKIAAGLLFYGGY